MVLVKWWGFQQCCVVIASYMRQDRVEELINRWLHWWTMSERRVCEVLVWSVATRVCMIAKRCDLVRWTDSPQSRQWWWEGQRRVTKREIEQEVSRSTFWESHQWCLTKAVMSGWEKSMIDCEMIHDWKDQVLTVTAFLVWVYNH